MEKLKILLPKGRIYENVTELFAGAGITIKLPERAYRPTVNQDDIEAKVAIEVKRHMKNEKEIHENFKQGRSYAKWGAAEVLMICDMIRIRIYQRNKKNRFEENDFIEFSWKDTENSDRFAELKKLLS